MPCSRLCFLAWADAQARLERENCSLAESLMNEFVGVGHNLGPKNVDNTLFMAILLDKIGFP